MSRCGNPILISLSIILPLLTFHELIIKCCSAGTHARNLHIHIQNCDYYDLILICTNNNLFYVANLIRLGLYIYMRGNYAGSALVVRQHRRENMLSLIKIVCDYDMMGEGDGDAVPNAVSGETRYESRAMMLLSSRHIKGRCFC